ncbi:hypothetical protein [Kitasatospora sp. NPDC056184]|uniref:hypothetical protein n=1 Tax=Kitasatospora sp. NPDC056184 TaxID=3345738 RepID=UPI0035D69F99
MTSRQLDVASSQKWRAARFGAAGVLVVGGMFLAGLKAIDLWRGETFPVADPVAVAQRLDAQTQTIYDALQLPQARLDPDWPGGGIEATIDNCHPRGLGNLSSVLSDSPPNEPGTAAVNESWALEGVPATVAAEAMARAERTLTAAGWKAVSYAGAEAGDASLKLTPPAADDGVVVRAGVVAFPSGALEVYATTECLRYPDGTEADREGRPYVPGRPDAPSQLRSRPDSP